MISQAHRAAVARALAFAFAAAIVSSGCATTKRAPLRSNTVAIGRSKATFRDYTGTGRDICDAEKRWVEEEFVSLNSLLDEWLDRTQGSKDDVWPTDKLQLLEDGARTLPPLLATYRRNLAASAHCSFAHAGSFASLHARGLELLRRAEDAVDAAPEVHAWVAYRIALEQWRTTQPIRVGDAMSLCPEKPRVGDALLFYAQATSSGGTQYHFCDGSIVHEGAEGETAFDPPVAATRRELRRIERKRYLDAAEQFPASSIDRPPSPPDQDSVAEKEADR